MDGLVLYNLQRFMAILDSDVPARDVGMEFSKLKHTEGHSHLMFA